jgi:hypothetical protein
MDYREDVVKRPEFPNDAQKPGFSSLRPRKQIGLQLLVDVPVRSATAIFTPAKSTRPDLSLGQGCSCKARK